MLRFFISLLVVLSLLRIWLFSSWLMWVVGICLVCWWCLLSFFGGVRIWNCMYCVFGFSLMGFGWSGWIRIYCFLWWRSLGGFCFFGCIFFLLWCCWCCWVYFLVLILGLWFWILWSCVLCRIVVWRRRRIMLSVLSWCVGRVIICCVYCCWVMCWLILCLLFCLMILLVWVLWLWWFLLLVLLFLGR